MVPSYGLIGQEDQTDFRNPVDPDAEIIRVSFSDEIGRLIVVRKSEYVHHAVY